MKEFVSERVPGEARCFIGAEPKPYALVGAAVDADRIVDRIVFCNDDAG